ncbi:MAG: hypothetical protein DLM68_14690 [Hyphomicrobiales bacterium]|nr:MAG: hypothetical protein DLM68_14690 [Hyphomicrobiales bacterium]
MTINYLNDTLLKIVRQGFGHACLPPAPACSLKEINANSKIPFDSIRSENALSLVPYDANQMWNGNF